MSSFQGGYNNNHYLYGAQSAVENNQNEQSFKYVVHLSLSVFTQHRQVA